MKAQTKKQLAGAATGLLDPILRKLAQELAASIPETSIVRSIGFETAMGVLKGFLEASADNLPLSAWATLEKATDFGDFFAGALKPGQKQKLASNWMENFFRDAEGRLANADDPAVEFKRLELEFDLRKKLIAKIEEGLKPSQTVLGSHRVEWQELFAKLKDFYRQKSRKLELVAEKLEVRASEKRRKGGYR